MSIDTRRADQAFDALLADASVRSKIGQLREVFDRVDQALRLGVSRSAVLATLRDLGLELKPSSFNEFVSRLRREREALRAGAVAPVAAEDGAAAVTISESLPLPAALATQTATLAQSAEPVSTPPSKRDPTFDPAGRSLKEIRESPRDIFALERKAQQRRRDERDAAEAATTTAQEADAAAAAKLAALSVSKPP